MTNKFKTGELKELLIQNGLKHLNDVGYQNFSIREVAKMCNASHSAPYKHFKSKEELLTSISMSVMESFKASLKKAMLKTSDEPATRLATMGVEYVRYMAENPEHMKFLFLTSQKSRVKIKCNYFEYTQGNPFSFFYDIAVSYLDSINVNRDMYVTEVLSIWSVVHGISVLIVEQSIVFDGNYLDYVSKMINNRLR